MIAEIYGKISSNGSNLSDRLEDNLTGDFFGTMRYIPFNKGMKPILTNFVYPREVASTIEKIDADFWNDNIVFWPYDDEGELDVLLNFPGAVIGIEVKYLSGISSDDGICNEKIPQFKSTHQLARESRIISRKGTGKDKILIFIADEAYCRAIYEDTINRNILENNVQLGILSWQDILTAIKSLNLENNYQQLMLSDLRELLIAKRFERFRTFDLGKDITIEDFLFYDFKDKKISFNIDEEVKENDFYEFR